MIFTCTKSSELRMRAGLGVKLVLQCFPSHSCARVQAPAHPLPSSDPALTYTLDTVHEHIYFLPRSQQCYKDVVVDRSEVSIRKEVCLIPQGNPCHVLTVHCQEKPRASASCCLRKQVADLNRRWHKQAMYTVRK